jgi:putative membrane protein insertion efficiency factor
MRKLLITPLLGLIYIYRYLISPLLPKGCRHFPSCSAYAIDALNMHGLVRGSILSANRIARCQPWGTSGYDPVPRFLLRKVKIRKRYGLNRKMHPGCNRLKPH